MDKINFLFAVTFEIFRVFCDLSLPGADFLGGREINKASVFMSLKWTIYFFSLHKKMLQVL